jgi:hypothetical protein
MSYFAAVPTDVGVNQLPHNPCRLLDFNYLALSDGDSYEGTSGQREILAVPSQNTWRRLVLTCRSTSRC